MYIRTAILPRQGHPYILASQAFLSPTDALPFRVRMSAAPSHLGSREPAYAPQGRPSNQRISFLFSFLRIVLYLSAFNSKRPSESRAVLQSPYNLLQLAEKAPTELPKSRIDDRCKAHRQREPAHDFCWVNIPILMLQSSHPLSLVY